MISWLLEVNTKYPYYCMELDWHVLYFRYNEGCLWSDWWPGQCWSCSSLCHYGTWVPKRTNSFTFKCEIQVFAEIWLTHLGFCIFFWMSKKIKFSQFLIEVQQQQQQENYHWQTWTEYPDQNKPFGYSTNFHIFSAPEILGWVKVCLGPEMKYLEFAWERIVFLGV